MAESKLGSERPVDCGRFGLADKISPAVSDYYDLLFDNVREYIGITREEVNEYQRDNAELDAKLTAMLTDDPDHDKEAANAIYAAMHENEKRIDELHAFLQSDRLIPVGIEHAEHILDDGEPELTDRFNAAPVTEKYSCLVNSYMKAYRSDLEEKVNRVRNEYTDISVEVYDHRHERPLTLDTLASFRAAHTQWMERLDALEHAADGKKKDWHDLQSYSETSSLVDIDAFRFGEKKVGELFPKIAEQFNEHKQAKYKDLLAADPVKLYSDLMMQYSTAHVATMGEQLFELRHDRDLRQNQLQEHDAEKPDWLKNLATFGNAGKAWKTEREELARNIAGIKKQIAELEKDREECKGGWLSEAARKEANAELEAVQQLLERNFACIDYERLPRD